MIKQLHRRRKSSSAMILVTMLVTMLLSGIVAAQQTCERIMRQDSTLNNFADPDGYQNAKLGEIQEIVRHGSGARKMILIAGLGFSGSIFEDIMAKYESEFSMYAVTIPGFGKSAAPASPPGTTSFGEQTWTNGAFAGIEALIQDEVINDAIVVGHWFTGTQLAFRLALKYPDKIKGVVIISGAPTFFTTDTSRFPAKPPLELRVRSIDQYMAPAWFKTVTRETWDDNNFLPQDYAVNPVRALRLWRMAAEPDIHVWTRYLCEFYAQDITIDLDSLKVPTLMLRPGLEDIYFDPGNNYLYTFCHLSWDRLLPGNSLIKSVNIPHTRVCMWFDQLDQVKSAIDDFLADSKN